MIFFYLVMGCTEYVVNEKEDIAPVEPPGKDYDPWGDTPDWEGCDEGYFGSYHNLTTDHQDVEPVFEPYPQDGHSLLDWWDREYLSFERYDASLDFGTNWWPVDEGFDQDPAYFSAYWTAWIRVFEDADLNFVIGASDDFWLNIDDEVKHIQAGINDFEPAAITVPMEEGQYQISIHYAHRSGDSGLRFRLTSEEAVICYPEFDEE